MAAEDKQVTIFESLDKGEVTRAIKSLIQGKTPISEIRQRPIGGGGTANYVNTYYMTRQISLITGFRWESECLEEKTYPATGEVKELGAKMKVTIYDAKGNRYSHISWGSAEIKKNLSYFDQWKAAYSDGIKKCLSYFGIANDVYGGKDLDFFGDEPPADDGWGNTGGDESRLNKEQEKAFQRYIQQQGLLPSKVCQILGITNIAEITDHKAAYQKLKLYQEGGE